MGSNTILERSAGQVILASFFNDIRSALAGDFMGRDTDGIPVSGNNLGTSVYPWGTAYIDQLVVGGVAFNNQELERPPYQIVSGKTRSTSNQPAFILPAGSAPTFSVLASATNLLLSIDGVSSSWLSDVTGIAVTVAASTQNTCTVNDAVFDSSAATRNYGEYGYAGSGTPPYYPITIASAGTHISGAAGTFQAFKVNTTGEIFIAFIESATQLSRVFRGFFYNSSVAPINRGVVANGGTLTLMNLGYVFADVDGATVDTIFTGSLVNNSPFFSNATPSGALSGDYWFDQGNQVWKTYNGSSWATTSRMLIGMVVADATNCIAARSLDFFGLCRSDNTVEIYNVSNTVMKSTGIFERINVNGKRIDFTTAKIVWDTASNLAASADRYNAAVTASQIEYFYITDDGNTKISDIAPYWRADLLGWYHPHNPWRCVAQDTVDGSAHFDSTTLINFGANSTPDIGDQQVTTRNIKDQNVTAGKIVTNIAFAGNFGSAASTKQIYGSGAGYNIDNTANRTLAQCLGGSGGRGYRIVSGAINSNGTVDFGEGFTSTKNGTGNYTVTLSVAGNTTIVPILTVHNNTNYVAADSSTSSAFTCTTRTDAGVGQDSPFYFVCFVQIA